MKLVFDFTLGVSFLHLEGGTEVEMRRPVLAEWCGWQEAHDRAVRHTFDAIAGEELAPAALDDAMMSKATADLNLRMFAATLRWFPFEGVDEDHPLWMAMTDRQITVELLTFWRDHPLSPWVNAADAAEVRSEEDGARLIRSSLPGALGARAVLYKALPQIHPGAIDRMELWQIAALLGRDGGTAEDGPEGGQLAVDGMDDGGRVRRVGNSEVRTWKRKPGAPFLFSSPAGVGPQIPS